MRRSIPAAVAVFVTFILCACAPSEPPSGAPPAETSDARPEIRLRYIEGSTAKVEQLIGDSDRQTKQPTLNQTQARYGITGTDLGYSFDHNGKTYFLFGDTIGPNNSDGGDMIGISTSTNPLAPMYLDFMTNFDGNYLRVQPPGISMGGYEIPTSGISLDGIMYVAVKTGYTPRQSTEYTVLTRYNEAQRTFEPLRELSRMPAGHFVTTSLLVAPPGLRSLPTPGQYVMVFGSGQYRRSNAYLSVVPQANFGTGAGTRYFAGLLPNGKPLWADDELAAVPIIEHATIGDISVQYIPDLQLWVSLYDSRSPRGIVMRYADEPWGPWSAPQIVFEPIRDQAWATYIHNPNASPPDDIGGPVIGPTTDAMRTQGGYYAPYVIERFTRIEGDRLTLQYVMSTWNPYVVVRMRSSMMIERGKQATTPSAASHGITAIRTE